MKFLYRAVIESLAVRQRDLLDEDDAILLDQDPEVTPGFFEGDMAGIYQENEVNYYKTYMINN